MWILSLATTTTTKHGCCTIKSVWRGPFERWIEIEQPQIKGVSESSSQIQFEWYSYCRYVKIPKQIFCSFFYFLASFKNNSILPFLIQQIFECVQLTAVDQRIHYSILILKLPKKRIARRNLIIIHRVNIRFSV